jgi:hypothetical protein
LKVLKTSTQSSTAKFAEPLLCMTVALHLRRSVKSQALSQPFLTGEKWGKTLKIYCKFLTFRRSLGFLQIKNKDNRESPVVKAYFNYLNKENYFLKATGKG